RRAGAQLEAHDVARLVPAPADRQPGAGRLGLVLRLAVADLAAVVGEHRQLRASRRPRELELQLFLLEIEVLALVADLELADGDALEGDVERLAVSVGEQGHQLALPVRALAFTVADGELHRLPLLERALLGAEAARVLLARDLEAQPGERRGG